MLVWLGRQTTQSRRTNCEHKQEVLAEAFTLHDMLRGELPGWREIADAEFVNDQAEGTPKMLQESWGQMLLPWIGRKMSEDERSGQQAIDESAVGPLRDLSDQLKQARLTEEKGGGRFIGEFVCPADPRMDRGEDHRAAWLTYVVNAGLPDEQIPDDASPDKKMGSGVLLDYTKPDMPRMTNEYIRDHDGTEFTLLLSENIDAGSWLDLKEPQTTFLWSADDKQPVLRVQERAGQGDGTILFARPSSQHVGGVNAVFVAQNSRFLNDAIDPIVLAQLMTSDEQVFPAENAVSDVTTKP